MKGAILLLATSIAVSSAIKQDDAAALIQKKAEEHMHQIEEEQSQRNAQWKQSVSQQSFLQYNASETIAAQIRNQQENGGPWNPAQEVEKKVDLEKIEAEDPAQATNLRQQQMAEALEAEVMARNAAYEKNNEEIINGIPVGNQYAPWDPRSFQFREEQRKHHGHASAPAPAPAAAMFVTATDDATLTASLIQYSGAAPRTPDEVVQYQSQEQTIHKPWYPGIERDERQAELDEMAKDPAIATIRDAEANLKDLKVQLDAIHPTEDYPALHYDADHPWTPPPGQEW
jgi:hypothetical protein